MDTDFEIIETFNDEKIWHKVIGVFSLEKELDKCYSAFLKMRDGLAEIKNK